MKIAFLDGTNVVEPSMEERVYRAVRAMIKEEETVTFFCRPESEWMQLCEWAARKIEAAYPQKRVERIGEPTSRWSGIRRSLRCPRQTGTR